MSSQDLATILETTLRDFDNIDLVKRDAVRRITDIYDAGSNVGQQSITIYRDNICYLGNGIQLVVFRHKGEKGAAREKTKYAFYNDISGLYQPVSVQYILQFLNDPPRGIKLEVDLSVVVESVLTAQKRTQTQQDRTV